MAILAYQYRFYPNEEQKQQLDIEFNAARKIYNWGLGLKKSTYETDGVSLNKNAISCRLTQLKKENTNWRNASDSVLRRSLAHMDDAFQNFFKSATGKRKGERVGFPKFKHKDVKKAIEYSAQTKSDVVLRNGKLKVPKIGFINIHWSRPLPADARLLKANVSLVSNKYLISITFETNISANLEPNTNCVGIDMGIKTFATTSDGEMIELPSVLKKLTGRLRRTQSRSSKAKNGSKRQKKLAKKKQRVQAKINNIKTDFIHKITTQLVKINGFVFVEGLNIKQMLQHKGYASAIQQQSWGEFFRCLKYKAEKFNRVYLPIGKYFASSQLCSACGKKNLSIKGSTRIRQWKCSCGASHDRDVNAAINIKHEGFRLFTSREGEWAQALLT